MARNKSALAYLSLALLALVAAVPAMADSLIVFTVTINPNVPAIPQNASLSGMASLFVVVPGNGQGGVPDNGTPINGQGVPLNDNGVPLNGQGVPVNGNGIPVNGTGFNGQPDNGQPCNGLPGNGQPCNGSLGINGLPPTNGAASIGIYPTNNCLALGTCELFFSLGGIFQGNNATLGFDAFAPGATPPPIQPGSAPIIPIGMLIPLGPAAPGAPVQATGQIIGFDDPVVVGTWEVKMTDVPEPGSAILLTSALAGLLALRRR